MGKSREAGSRSVVARGWGEGGMGSHCLLAVGFPLGVTKSSRMRCGDDYKTLFNATDCTFYNGKNGEFYVVFLPQ